MPKAAEKPLSLKNLNRLALRNSKGITLGDILKKVSNFKATQVLYGLLLIAVFMLGYLIARVQYLEKGSTTTTAQTVQPTGIKTAPSAPSPADVLKKLTNPRLPIRGNNNAKVSIVDFSDFECPFCARFFSDTLSQLTKEYIDSGKVKLEYRHYPLPFHSQAKPLAIASECANNQGKFWEMHDKIFEENTAGGLTGATAETYRQWAKNIGLNADQFATCLDDQKIADIVDKDTKLGSSVGVSGTPTFYINGRQLVGAQPFTAFKTIIDEELKK